jgi:hypothetical protein
VDPVQLEQAGQFGGRVAPESTGRQATISGTGTACERSRRSTIIEEGSSRGA